MDDKPDISSLINAEFIVNQLVGADDELRQRLVDDLAGAFAASQRSYNQQDVNQSKVLRVLQSGSPVTTDTAGLTKDLSNKSLAKTLDFRGQTVQIDPNNHEIFRILGGSGSDCLFDYLVSTCAATLSGFVEGQTFTSLSGCTFKMYSTLSGMQTALQTAGVAATVAICGGTYAETWTINGATLSGKRVSYFGASSAKVVISALAFASGTFTDTKGLTLKEIQVTSVDLAGADSTWFEDCVLGTVTVGSATTIRDIHFKTCEISAVTGVSGVQWAGCSFENCSISSLVFSTGTCNLGPMRIDSCDIGGLDQGTGGAGTDVQILNCSLTGSVNSGANVVRLTQCDGLIISGCEIAGGVTGATIQLRETVGRAWGFDISGNRFGNNANGYLGTSAANKEVTRGYFGANTFSTDGGAAVKAIHATANFGYVTFGPNGPDIMDYSSVVTTSGGNAYYTGGTTPTGVTAVFAPPSAPFVTIGNVSTLSAERALTAGANISLVDNGANSTVVIAASGLAATTEPYVTIGNSAGLSAERALTAGTGITITDGGANSTVTIALTTTPNTARELVWFSQTPVTGDNLAYQMIRFNGAGATAISPLQITAKDYGYGTTTINLLRAPNAHTVAAAGGLPNPNFTSILTSDLNIESSHMTMTGIEDVTITGGAVSPTALAFDDILRTNVDSVNNMIDMAVALTVTVP